MIKKILMIIAPVDFRDEEYLIPKKLFLEKGFEIATCSSKLGECTGKLGARVASELLLQNAQVADFNGVIFVGGSGSYSYINNKYALSLAREAISSGKILGAICAAPQILAQARVLKNKRATVWHTKEDMSAVEFIKEKGAIFEDDGVVKDGKIITADGPENAERFAQEIINTLNLE